MTIQFDDAVADSLVQALQHASDQLFGQGVSRRSAADEAHVDFSGAYATLLTGNCVLEAEDRGKLRGVLDALVIDVAEAKSKANDERARIQALADWQSREDRRVRDRALDATGATHADASDTDPRPSTYEIAPPTISAAFIARERVRGANSKDAGRKSSANPSKLRSFVATSRGLNTRLESEVVSVQNAWAGFVSSCTWVEFGSMTFTEGFARMVTENTADATWVERIAAQFEKAGGSGVLNSQLDRAAKATILDIAAGKRFQQLLDGKLSPEEAAEYWRSLGLTPDDVKMLPPEALMKLASMSGLPAWAQDAAGRAFLDYAIDQPQAAYDLMGFTDPYVMGPDGVLMRVGQGITLSEFTAQMQGIRDELHAAGDRSESLNGGAGEVIQLVGLGSHDGALVAGISIGDLDTASNIGVNVSGMNSGVSDMANGDRAAHALHKSAWNKDPNATYAVVNWVGYRSPTATEVHGMVRANSGADRLTGFLNGINANRLENGTEPQQFNVYAHSYGSTTAAKALQQTNFSVDRLVTYGSAGLENGTKLNSIHADKVYATHAKGDFWAKKGQAGAKSVDPLDIGAIRFSSSNTVAPDGTLLKRTTMHSMYEEEDRWTVGNMWAGTVGYQSPGSTSLDRMANMLVNGTATQ